MSISRFISTIDGWASEGRPFLFLVDFEMEKPFACLLDEAESEGVFYDLKGRTNAADIAASRTGDMVLSPRRDYVGPAEYGRAFDIVQRNLRGGNTYLCNLTFATGLEAACGIGAESVLKEIFAVSRAPYKLLFKDQFTLFSPECFIRIEDGFIYSYPMKGTIDASVPDAENRILSDQKEFWEHNTIVDLIRNDLSIVSTGVEVTRFRYIDRIRMPDKELLQVSSEIRGRLPGAWRENLGSLLMKLLPAGSISGAPKQKTVEVIREAEHGRRGYYTGIFGIFDGRNLDSAVNIRFIERDGSRLLFRSGGGITAESGEDAEYRELKDKVNVPVG